MKFERTATGLEASLKVTCLGRLFPAAFLAFWLAGWAVGEAFAMGMLCKGGWALLNGQPAVPARDPVAPVMSLFIGLFLLVWLAFWTLGGLAAGRELLRLLLGRDRIRATAESLEIEHRWRLFRSRRTVPRQEIRRFHRTASGGALSADTEVGTVELTRLGTATDRAELERALEAHFQLAPQPALHGALPDGWCECPSLERDRVLVKDPTRRRKQAMVTWVITAALAALAAYFIGSASRRPELWALAAMLTAAAGMGGWGAVWLSVGRHEWRLDRGRLVLQRRFGANRTTPFEAASVELVEDNSGDSTSYLLQAVAADAPDTTRVKKPSRHRRTLHRESEDPAVLRRFGLWLHQRCQIPFADRTTAEAKAKEFEALKLQLTRSGWLGRAALSLVERHVPTPRHPDAGT